MRTLLFISLALSFVSCWSERLSIPTEDISQIIITSYNDVNKSERVISDSIFISDIMNAVNCERHYPAKFVKRYEIHIYRSSQEDPLVIYGSGRCLMINGKTYRIKKRIKSITLSCFRTGA